MVPEEDMEEIAGVPVAETEGCEARVGGTAGIIVSAGYHGREQEMPMVPRIQPAEQHGQEYCRYPVQQQRPVILLEQEGEPDQGEEQAPMDRLDPTEQPQTPLQGPKASSNEGPRLSKEEDHGQHESTGHGVAIDGARIHPVLGGPEKARGQEEGVPRTVLAS